MENDPEYGKVYHVGSAAEELDMLRRENGLMWQAHPRTKGSTGYPDAVREWPHFSATVSWAHPTSRCRSISRKSASAKSAAWACWTI